MHIKYKESTKGHHHNLTDMIVCQRLSALGLALGNVKDKLPQRKAVLEDQEK
jgi:hypothetical protein